MTEYIPKSRYDEVKEVALHVIENQAIEIKTLDKKYRLALKRCKDVENRVFVGGSDPNEFVKLINERTQNIKITRTTESLSKEIEEDLKLII